MDFQVGQIIFIVLKRKQQVLPARVVEEIKKKTLRGEETSYNAEVPIKDELKIVPLGELNCDIFSSTEEAKKFLLSNTSDFIDTLMQEAERIAIHRFGQPSAQITPTDLAPEENKLKIQLENGTVATVNVPEGM